MYRFEASSLALIGFTTAIAFASIALYRLTFHPLAKFPGPKLAAITRYYEGYYDLVQNGQYTFKIAQLHKEYGPIIRISPYELHVDDPSFFEKIYRQEGRWDKYDWTYDAFSAPYSTICTPNHDLHRHRRAPLNPFFSRASIAAKQEFIQGSVKKLCDRIDQHVESNKLLNLGTAFSALARDIATKFIIDKSYDNLDTQDFNVALTNIFQSSGSIWRTTKHIRWFGPFMMSLPTSLVEKMADEGSKSFFAFLNDMARITKNIIAAEKSTPTASPSGSATMIHAILNSKLPEAEKTFKRINDEVATVTGAAFETTAQTLRVICYHIYSDFTILRRLRDELRSTHTISKDTELVKLSILEQKPYLTAVLMEGLRLSPGIATRMARIAPDRDLVFQKWIIPAGTPVGMTSILMHTNEKIYHSPRKFMPDRWLDLEERKKAEKTYAPFSRGTRVCLGMHLAWAELYITIAAIVQLFDFQFSNVGLKDIEPTSDQFIIGTNDQNGVNVFVKRAKLT